MKAEYSKRAMNAALDMVFNGETQKTATIETGIGKMELHDKLVDLECRHPDCSEMHPCRSAIKRYGGKMTCTLLDDTKFRFKKCPFYKTENEFHREFKASNRLSVLSMKERGYV